MLTKKKLHSASSPKDGEAYFRSLVADLDTPMELLAQRHSSRVRSALGGEDMECILTMSDEGRCVKRYDDAIADCLERYRRVRLDDIKRRRESLNSEKECDECESACVAVEKALRCDEEGAADLLMGLPEESSSIRPDAALRVLAASARESSAACVRDLESLDEDDDDACEAREMQRRFDALTALSSVEAAEQASLVVDEDDALAECQRADLIVEQALRRQKRAYEAHIRAQKFRKMRACARPKITDLKNRIALTIRLLDAVSAACEGPLARRAADAARRHEAIVAAVRSDIARARSRLEEDKKKAAVDFAKTAESKERELVSKVAQAEKLLLAATAARHAGDSNVNNGRDLISNVEAARAELFSHREAMAASSRK